MHGVRTFWFWQTEASPHVTSLVVELDSREGSQASLLVREYVSSHRREMGWTSKASAEANLVLMPSVWVALKTACQAPENVLHVMQGLRGSGYIFVLNVLLFVLGKRRLILLEDVDFSGAKGRIKSFLYRLLLLGNGRFVDGFLAIGDNTPGWLQQYGIPNHKIFPFAYFLAPMSCDRGHDSFGPESSFRLVFVGQVIERKRLDLLLDALEGTSEKFELDVIGDGPLVDSLMRRSKSCGRLNIRWRGKLPMDVTRRQLDQYDCLVLPSRFDGWGAVIVEALMSGVPVLCSDTCGAAGIVRASGEGGVFTSGDSQSLRDKLEEMLRSRRISLSRRLRLRRWAQSLSIDRGAEYLLEITYAIDKGRDADSIRPVPPWLVG